MKIVSLRKSVLAVLITSARSRTALHKCKNKNRRIHIEWPVSLLARLLLGPLLRASDQMWATGSSPPIQNDFYNKFYSTMTKYVVDGYPPMVVNWS